MASVTIDNVRKRFGDVEVLNDISVSVGDGEFLVLVGPSGCGKSTLLRIIAGLEEIIAGTISINQQVVNGKPPKERDIAMVFQNYALYPHLTVAENMAFSMMLAKAPKAEKARRVKEAAEILGLGDLLDRKPRQLSGGQRQRVAMGRAIIRDPQVFLFDEPLSNLDAKLRVAMRAEIRALHQRLKTSFIYVTHDQVEAMTMADRIVVMNEGRIDQTGSPLELYDNPCNLFVAGFIGSPAMNLLPGQASSNGNNAVVKFESGLTLPLPPDLSIEDGRQVTYGIRPEYCRLGTDESSSEITLDALVVEPMGAETHLILSFDTSQLIAAVRERPSVKPGDRVPLGIDIDKVLLFDSNTGLRI